LRASGYHAGDSQVSGVFVSPQDVLDELEDERYDLVLTWREEHPELLPFSVADVLYLLRCERVGLQKDLRTGTTLVPFMSPQERRDLERVRVRIEGWIDSLERLGVTDDRTAICFPP